MDVRRDLVDARAFWRPTMLPLHQFMVAVPRVLVNHDGRGGYALDPVVWDRGRSGWWWCGGGGWWWVVVVLTRCVNDCVSPDATAVMHQIRVSFRRVL